MTSTTTPAVAITVPAPNVPVNTPVAPNDYNIENLDKYSYDGYPHEQGALVNMLKTEKY